MHKNELHSAVSFKIGIFVHAIKILNQMRIFLSNEFSFFRCFCISLFKSFEIWTFVDKMNYLFALNKYSNKQVFAY